MRINTFTCSVCGQTKPAKAEGGTGYGRTESGDLICYTCCGERDRADMIATGKATLYLSAGEVMNWPGTLRFKTGQVQTGRHNIAGKRHDVWFHGPDKALWHGVQYGDNTQIVHCRRTKG